MTGRIQADSHRGKQDTDRHPLSFRLQTLSLSGRLDIYRQFQRQAGYRQAVPAPGKIQKFDPVTGRMTGSRQDTARQSQRQTGYRHTAPAAGRIQTGSPSGTQETDRQLHQQARYRKVPTVADKRQISSHSGRQNTAR